MTKRGGRAPTLADVARHAGVSISTVSRVVRHHADVSDESREAVQESIRELHYRPSTIARALVSGMSNTLALLVSDISNPFYPQLARAIERSAAHRGYALLICNTEDSVAESRRHLERLIAHGVDGIIHASVGKDEETIRDLVADRTPVVFVNRRPKREDAHYAVADNDDAARQLTRHLLSLGHRRVGFIAGPDYAANAVERLEGWMSEMRMNAGAEPLVSEGGFGARHGQEAMHLWLDSGAAPTAVVGVNDTVAVGAMDAILAAGMTVPEDISVAGFDDIELASSQILDLTSVAYDTEGLAERSVQMVIRAIRTPGTEPMQETSPVRLRVRGSTGPVRGTGPSRPQRRKR
jgi:DNA-binding LacI/PurR family transcriptional regulator